VRQENADFRRDMMTSSLRGRGQAALSPDDVSKLTDKLAELWNGTLARQVLVKHDAAAAGLPRGTVQKKNYRILTYLLIYLQMTNCAKENAAGW